VRVPAFRGYLRDVIRGRVPPGVLLVGRALVVVLAVVPLFLVLTRSVPPAPAGTAAAPDGLGGIGSGVADSPSPPTADPVGQLSVPDGIPPVSPVGVLPPPNPGALGVPAAAGGAGAAPPPAPAPRPNPNPNPNPLPFRASYTVHSGLTGYDGSQVTLTNPNGAPRTGWQVVFQLAAGQMVTGAKDATYAQSLTTVTFTPKGGPVPAHGSLVFTFTVTGTGVLGGPTACTVDGNPCQLTK
jgi:hypothetical protein